MESLGCIKEEGGTSFVSNYSIRPPIRFEIPQSWTNLLLFYFYKWPCGGGRHLWARTKWMDGCWLDYNLEIFVSVIICQVLSTITSISDIRARITHYPAWLLTANQIGDCHDCHDPSARLLHRCQSPSSAQHFSQISLILSQHFCGRDNISEGVIITHQSSGCSPEYQNWMMLLSLGHHWPPLIGHMSLRRPLIGWCWSHESASPPGHGQSLDHPLYLTQHLFSSHPETSGWHQNSGILCCVRNYPIAKFYLC